MRWRKTAIIALGLLLVAALGALESQRILTGWVRGEAFCHGRPTTYWRAELSRWWLDPPGAVCVARWVHDETGWEAMLRGWIPDSGSPKVPLQDGDPAAEAVLLPILQDRDAPLPARRLAEQALRKIREKN